MVSDRALPEGVERFDVAGMYGRVLRNMQNGRWIRYSDLPKIEAHLATRLLSDEVVEAALTAGREAAAHGVFNEGSEQTIGELQERVIRRALQAAISAVIGKEAGR
jgi:hypothetical protein